MHPHECAPLKLPDDRIYLRRALDWLHNGSEDSYGFDWHHERQDTNHPLRHALVNGEIESWCIREDGRQFKIPRYHWSGQRLWLEAYSTSLQTVECDGSLQQGYLIIDRRAFISALFPTAPIITNGSEASGGILAFPYIHFMEEVIYRFDLEPGYRFLKKPMVDWMIKHKPVDLDLSDNKAGYIATLLRDSKFDKGGNINKSIVDGKRSSDPFATHQGVIYPKPARE